MKKKVLIQFGINERRISSIFNGLKKAGVKHDFFSYYKEDRKLDDFPADFEENEWLSIASLPALLYSSKRDPVYYKDEGRFLKWNERFIQGYFGTHMDKLEQEYIFEEIKAKNIPYLPMLNESAKFCTMDELRGIIAEEEVFVKPNSVFKEFIGGVWHKGEMFDDYLVRKKWGGKDAGVMLNQFSKIHSEYRFFVYDGVPLTGSSYIVNGQINTEFEIPDVIWKEAHRLGVMYQPAPLYTLDLCLLEDGSVKIVEYNGFAASGSYNCDLGKVFAEVCR